MMRAPNFIVYYALGVIFGAIAMIVMALFFPQKLVFSVITFGVSLVLLGFPALAFYYSEHRRLFDVLEKEVRRDYGVELTCHDLDTAYELTHTLQSALFAKSEELHEYRRFFDEWQRIASERAIGDFSRRIDNDNQIFDLQATSQCINSTGDSVESFLSRLEKKLHRAAAGEFETLEMPGIRGRFKNIEKNYNEVISQLLENKRALSERAEAVLDRTRDLGVAQRAIDTNVRQAQAALLVADQNVSGMLDLIRRNNSVADEVHDLSENALRNAESGSSVVEEAISAINTMNRSGKDIVDITSMIDEIAFQTNLLALNASVEAARAGEQGKGFGVVANEVRELAQRSADAAKQINKLIDTSIKELSKSVALVHSSGDALKHILVAVRRVNASVKEISQLSLKQMKGIQVTSCSMEKINVSITEEIAKIRAEAELGITIDAEARQLRANIKSIGAPRGGSGTHKEAQ